MTESTKVCTKCGVEKSLPDFTPRKCWCRECVKSYNRIYRSQNKSKLAEQQRTNRAAKKDYYSTYWKKRWSTKRSSIQIVNKAWRLRNRDQISAYMKKRWETKKDIIRDYKRNHRQLNRVKLRTYFFNYRHASPQRMLEHSISNLVRQSLVSGKGGKSWETLVGYTIQDLRVHLESLFTEGMAWDNYGASSGHVRWWTIDHKKPRSHFSYLSPEDPQFKECWGLPNLQPMWFNENFSKCNRRDDSQS